MDATRPAGLLVGSMTASSATSPPTALWHFGWHVTDVRASLDRYRRSGTTLLPLSELERRFGRR